MQHLVHIFIGDGLAAFRDKFASTYRSLHPDHGQSLFTALSLTVDDEDRYILTPDECGDSLDGTTADKDVRGTVLYNFFEDMYCRKVTVAHPGNQSMVAVIWARLFDDGNIGIIQELTAALARCRSNIHIEVTGFTHDAVSCFVPNPLDRKSPESYKAAFDRNIVHLRRLRPELRALRLIANRNMDNVALDLDEDAMARICAEHAALSCEHYLDINPPVVDYGECPFESFGISSIIFDVAYYRAYIKNRCIIDKMRQQGIDDRSFNINALAQSTNPILEGILAEIHEFKDKQAAHARATLSLNGGATASNIVGTMDDELKSIVRRLKDKIHGLAVSGRVSTFESEALLSLILGEDNPMFDSSAVDAREVTIDDIINEGAEFFLHLDSAHTKLRPVDQSEIKNIRKRMRNIAVANRGRMERLKALNANVTDEKARERHLSENGYNFGGTEYQVNLDIDREPLELTYTPHDVSAESIDMSDRFAPVRNQGKQGSCAAFAVASVIEALRRDSRRYSPAFLYWTARDRKNAADSDAGSSLYDIIKAATDKGVCTEESMPYNADIFTLAPTEAAISEARGCMLIEARTVEPNLRDIKSALADGFPVIIASKIFDSFSDTNSGFVRHPSSAELADGSRSDGHGNHAMVVCGFSDKERILIVRNSWGKEFGKNGYCYIPYSYARQYFLQACIITKVSPSGAPETDPSANTINFNFSDSNIEAAILQNLIDEDNYELKEMAEESARLRTVWSQNVGLLGNVNNQAEIVHATQENIKADIFENTCTIRQLQSAESGKVWDFKKKYIIRLIYLGLTLLSFAGSLFLWPTSIVLRAIVAVLTVVFISLAGAFSYKWRKFRQGLRDEIQSHAERVSHLQQQKADLEIKAHIYGTILRETEHYRLELLSQFRTLRHFNQAWLSLYKQTLEELRDMSPEVPYPFLSVLENNLLDRYYDTWRHKMTDAIDLHTIFAEYTDNDNLEDIIAGNDALNRAIMRGLKGFGMKEYITRQNIGRWLFLPDNTSVARVIPDLDARALPFCPYYDAADRPRGKYIFVNGITQDETASISRYFTQAPMPVSTSSPYSISILDVVRYDLEHNHAV